MTGELRGRRRPNCHHCGGPKGKGGDAWNCATCTPIVRAEASARLNLCGAPGPLHHRWTCLQCQRVATDRAKAAARRGVETRRLNNANWGPPRDADRFWRGKAHSMVASAIKRGVLPKLDGSIACVDCGRRAHEYDHRDYGRPLEVEPVCRCCNKARGTAKYPQPQTFKRLATPETAAA